MARIIKTELDLVEVEQEIIETIDTVTGTSNDRGLWIPDYIMKMDNLNWTERHLLSYIINLRKSIGKGCYAKRDYLAKKFHATPQYITEVIKSLKDKFLIYSVPIPKEESASKRILHIHFFGLAKALTIFWAKTQHKGVTLHAFSDVECDNPLLFQAVRTQNSEVFEGDKKALLRNSRSTISTTPISVGKAIGFSENPESSSTNMTSRIRNNKLLKKKNEVGKKLGKVRVTKTERILQHWNTLENVRTHKIDRKSKLYKKLYMYISNLQNGTFANVKLDQAWLKDKRIPTEWIERKYDIETIKKVIGDLSLLFKQGYWPEDKAWLPKDLPTLIYNPRSGKSMFLSVLMEPPQELTDHIFEKEYAELDNLQEPFDNLKAHVNNIRRINNPHFAYNGENRQFMSIIKDSVTAFNKYSKTHYKVIPEFYHPFINSYITWVIKNVGSDKKISARKLLINGVYWKRFMEAVYNIDLWQK